jgi:diguanylate cyclase (GGDEF)-like protein/PAS domain S-box-containing protein
MGIIEDKIKALNTRLLRAKKAEREARALAMKYRRALDSTLEGFMMLDAELCITEVNPALLKMTGFTAEALIGRRMDGLYDHGRVEFYSASREHLSFEADLSAGDGRLIPVLFNRSTLRDVTGHPVGYMVFLNELTELKAAQEELQQAERRYRSMYRNAVQGMFQATLQGKLIRANPAYAALLGYGSAEEMAALKGGAAHLYFAAERERMIRALRRKGVLANYEVKLRHKDGKPVWALANYRLTKDERGEPIVEGILVDHTKQKRLEERLRRGHERFRELALLDNLTGLHNTRFLYQELDRLISARRGGQTPFSLIFMDMDNFKAVVDAHGHLNGSQALKEVAQTIKSAIPAPGFGVAYGGDEFVVVLPGFSKAQAKAKAEEIRLKMRRTAYLKASGLAVSLKASFGIAAFPEDARDRSGILALADKAMFRVKQTGKDSVGTSK